MYSTLELNIAKNVAKITLKNAPVNALSPACLKDISKVLESDQIRSASSLLITTAYPKVFSAGLDLKTLIRTNESPLDFKTRIHDYIGLFQNTCKLLLSSPLPTASAISGACPAGGTVLSLCCDIRVLSTECNFFMGLNEVAVGMAPPLWVHTLARLTITPSAVFPFMELGRFVFDINQIKKLGLVTESADNLESAVLKAQELLHVYESVPPIARRDAKLKGRQIILDQMNHEAINGVVDSICGTEFQSMARKILIGLCQSSSMNISCLNVCPESIPIHESLPIKILFTPDTNGDEIRNATVSITSSNSSIVWFSEDIQWKISGNNTLSNEFIFSPDAQNVPLAQTIPVNILVAWTEIDVIRGVVSGAASQNLQIVVTDLKPNFMIRDNLANHVSNWIFVFILIQTL